MLLEKKLFDISASAYIDRLCNFIRDKMSELHRNGILVPLSGGLDSTTVLLLCVRAVGKEQVKALLMPEKQGNPDAEKFARRVTDRFGIKTITRDISKVLGAMGGYRFILSRIPSRRIQDLAVKSYFHRSERNSFLRIVRGEADPRERKGFAKYNSKHRIRAVIAYLLGEEMNCLVAGCAHKSEDMLGLFVKFGVDDSADIMPLKNLYRTQILQIAEELGVPDEILGRTPNPDIIPGVADKYMDILGLPSETLDLLICGIEQGLEDQDIAAQLGIQADKVREIRDLIARTGHMRNPSQTLSWE